MARISFYRGKGMRYPPWSEDRLAGMKREALVSYGKMHRSRNHVKIFFLMRMFVQRRPSVHQVHVFDHE